MRLGRIWLAFAVSFSLSGLASAATEDRLLLTWHAPTECPSIEQVRADVRALLARDPTSNGEPIAVDATIRSVGIRGYWLSLSANGQTRQISGVSCAKLAEAAALLMALLLDPSLARSARAAARNTKPTSIPAPEPPEERPPAPKSRRLRVEPNHPSKATPSTVTGTKVSWVLELGAQVDWGTWPAMEPTVVAGFGAQRASFRLLSHVGLAKTVHLYDRHANELKLLPFSLGIEPAYRFSL